MVDDSQLRQLRRDLHKDFLPQHSQSNTHTPLDPMIEFQQLIQNQWHFAIQ